MYSNAHHYRALNELYLSLLVYAPQDEQRLRSVWDDFVMCKVLPRIEGDNNKLQGASADDTILGELKTLLVRNGMSDGERIDLMRHIALSDQPLMVAYRSVSKIEWMQKRLDQAGFTNFWP